MNRVKKFIKEHGHELTGMALMISGPVIGTAMIVQRATKERWTPHRIWPNESDNSVAIETKNKRIRIFRYVD